MSYAIPHRERRDRSPMSDAIGTVSYRESAP